MNQALEMAAVNKTLSKYMDVKHIYQILNGGSVPQVTGHRSRVTGHESQVTGHRSRVTGHGSRVTGHGSQIYEYVNTRYVEFIVTTGYI
jgi:hypothetical protein